jgi:SOS regulatory protein LexA
MEKYYQGILAFYKKAKRMPSYQEIMNLTGFKSKNAVFKLINRLVQEGLIEKDSQGRIVPKRIFGETKVLGVVEAGFPSPAEEELLDTMSLDEYLISNKEATFILKVSGNSMIDAGIMPKDLVLVERTNEAKPGDIVIAEVDGKWTMKYLRQNGDQMYLEAANKKYPPIYPKEELKISAVVKAVIRKY